MKISSVVAVACSALSSCAQAQNTTFYNPILPGWHSDPSCTQFEGTFFCVTSTFISFPGLPIYASRDLRNWKLIGHVWNRESQLAGISQQTYGQQDGMFAATIRHHEGEFWVACEYLGQSSGIIGVTFRSSNPYDESTWSVPIRSRPTKIDPDLYWENGTLYSATHSVVLQELDPVTGALTPERQIWNGTGGVWPEGPHLYHKDDYRYLLIAEGGTATDHAVMMARTPITSDIYSWYQASPHNPHLTNRGQNEFFQTVGHADLFQDAKGNWWGVALATRSGREWQVYPMGREAVLFPVTWEKNDWPVMAPVRGQMSGWEMPALTRELPGTGPFNHDPDRYSFPAGSVIPRNLVYWRVPPQGGITVGPQGGLVINPTRGNLTGSPGDLDGRSGLAFVGRRQTDTLFTFTVDVTFNPANDDAEAGATIFLTQYNHIDIGIVKINDTLNLRFRVEARSVSVPIPAAVTAVVPTAWLTGSIRLEIKATDRTTYTLAAGQASDFAATRRVLGSASARLVSGGTGTFVGSLIGTYATCHGAGSGTTCPTGNQATFRRWRYTGEGQAISSTEIVPSTSWGSPNPVKC